VVEQVDLHLQMVVDKVEEELEVIVLLFQEEQKLH